VPAVLDGVRDILSERWAEDAVLVQTCASGCGPKGLLQSKLMAGKDENDPDVAKFRDYFDYDEPIGRVPSHRALAVFRGPHAGDSGRQAGAAERARGARPSPAVWPRAASPCTWAGATRAARPTT
jgi:uncharacterized protein